MRRRLVLLIATAAVLSLSAAAGAKTRTFTAASNGHTVHIDPGDTLVVKLTEVQDGGYMWHTLTVPKKSILKTLSSTYVPPRLKKGEVGGAGTRFYKYRAAGSGTTRIRLGDRQAGSTTFAETFTLKVVVGRLGAAL